MIIYFDILFLINLIMNFVILYFVGLVLNLSKNPFRILIGALIGCVFLLSVFSQTLYFLDSLIFKVLVSVLMISVSFHPKALKDFIKQLGFFYLISFMVGGGALAFFYFFNLSSFFPKGILLINNISIPWWILLISSLSLFVVFKYIWPLIYHMLSKDALLVPVSIFLDQKKICINALIDTGNDLHDPLSDYPVIIVEFDAVKDMFTSEIQNFLKSSCEDNLKQIDKTISGSELEHRFRLIPYESIGKSKGLMVGFRPDLVTIFFNNKLVQAKKTVIGIYQRTLSSDGKYHALMNPDLLRE
ncbi:MAG: sigma-E processing peptidase SpoIIGA [Thermoanaerobacterales bacterium]|nr:sigma-E processing peptidase SpoIIGA [Thermoanaerobacterales bacterium]